MPITDASQDWLLLHGEEINSFTVLKFVRKIETCDTTYDITIPVCIQNMSLLQHFQALHLSS
ncbi:hypothetical protein DPMN_047172 [Dreissena polymorpha]|uniref:Uncharacterized protein n=1 Tax=Dreissena polymorpha TaxID=45954 RepID=A0A9D4D9W3_DREPO|nr:hypothetical protein DPMN_047172 [Dreissena polymorpha]